MAFTREPIIAGACPTCIWGPLAAWTRDAVKPYGYTVRICWNCNRQLSVPTVAKAMETPPLLPADIALGDPAPPKGKVDFGVTNSHTLWRAYEGDGYADGPQKHLRLLAYIEDLYLIQAAAKKSVGLKSLEEIAQQRLQVALALDGSPFIADIVRHYGLDRLESWGGTIKHGFGGEARANRSDFDVLITAHGGLAGNVENDLLYEVSQKFDLEYLPFSAELTEYMVKRYKLEVAPVPRGLLRGIDKPMSTLARNGQSVYARETCPTSSPSLSRKRSTKAADNSSTSTDRTTTTLARCGKVSAKCRCIPAPNATTAKWAICVWSRTDVAVEQLVDPATAALIIVDMQKWSLPSTRSRGGNGGAREPGSASRRCLQKLARFRCAPSLSARTTAPGRIRTCGWGAEFYDGRGAAHQFRLQSGVQRLRRNQAPLQRLRGH